MQIVDIPRFAPAMCLWRMTRTGPLLDLGREFVFEHEGHMYLSVKAVKEFAEAVQKGAVKGQVDDAAWPYRLVPINEIEAVTEAIAQKDAEIDQLQARVAELEQALQATEVIKALAPKPEPAPKKPAAKKAPARKTTNA